MNQPDAVDSHAGQQVFLTLQGIMMGVCMLLIPAYAGIRLAAERSDTNVDLLFISTLKPRAIIWGKFLAAVILLLMIFSACAPFMTFTYLLRGIDIPSILLVLGIDLLALLFGTMMALFFASIPSNLGLKVLLLLFCLWVLVTLFGYAMAGSVAVLEAGLGARMHLLEFWGVVGGIAAAALGTMGLFFVWSVALVSPPSSNRALRVRLYMVALWLMMGVIAAALDYNLTGIASVVTWQGVMLFLFCLQVVISINERDHWGPRVARAIPRNPLLRTVAFLTYSGAAGGLSLGLLMLGLTIGVGTALLYWLQGRLPTGFRVDDPGQTAKILTIISLYVYAYALTAVLCRRAFFGDRLRPVHTWVLMAILVAVGSALPYVFILTLPDNSLMFERENTWVILTNPVTAAMSAANQQLTDIANFDWLCLFFVAAWSVVVTMLSMPWLMRQLHDFRPPSRPSGGKVPAVAARPAASAALANGAAARVPPEAVTHPAPVQEAPAVDPGA
jgi:hypothetical protein